MVVLRVECSAVKLVVLMVLSSVVVMADLLAG